MNHANGKAREHIHNAALTILQNNDMGTFIRPGTYQYPHQWNWDSALIALGLVHVNIDRNIDRAKHEVRQLLAGQWRDGMVPHVIYHPTDGSSDYFPTADFWQTPASITPDVPTSGITQPPILATCLWRMYQHQPDAMLPFLQEVYTNVLNWHRWLHQARDPEQHGLVSIIHPWESGTDNAARWVSPLARITPKNVPTYQRRDAQHVDASERPFAAEYQRFIYLIDQFRHVHYEPDKIYATSPFLVEDSFFNAITYQAEKDLRQIAMLLGEPTEELDNWLTRTQQAFQEKLWLEQDALSFYTSFDVRHNLPIYEHDIATFAPLFAGLASQTQAEALVENTLLQADFYAPDEHTRYFLPSLAKTSLFYEPRRYWRGPVWIVTNWLIMQGLRDYGYAKLADTLKEHSLTLLEQGFYEYYDPRDGTPAGASGFSWSAALALELLNE